MSKTDLRTRLDYAVAWVHGKTDLLPAVGVVLGSGLGGFVDRLERSDRGDVDQSSPSTVRHIRNEFSSQKNGGMQQEISCLGPGLPGVLHEETCGRTTSIRDENIDSLIGQEPFGDTDQHRYISRLSQITDGNAGLSAGGGFDLFRCFFQTRNVPGVEDDIGPLAHEHLGGRVPQTGRGAGNQRPFTFQS